MTRSMLAAVVGLALERRVRVVHDAFRVRLGLHLDRADAAVLGQLRRRADQDAVVLRQPLAERRVDLLVGVLLAERPAVEIGERRLRAVLEQRLATSDQVRGT